MDRSLAGRPPVRVDRPPGSAAGKRAQRQRPGARPEGTGALAVGRLAGRRPRWPPSFPALTARRPHWGPPFPALTAPVRKLASHVWRRRRLRIALLAVLAALPLLAGGWLWLRDSSLVAVRQVEISGVHGPEAHEIRAALVAEARHLSTLDVDSGALRSAAAPFSVVREVRAAPSLPHGLHIQVVEQLPVAALSFGGVRTAVAADGVVLGPALLTGSIPVLSGGTAAGATVLQTGQRLTGPTALAGLTVLGAAPASLERLIAQVGMGTRGLTVTMRNGLLAYFGDASRPHAKWLALERVLADPGSAGASYVDVRMPERPAAGFTGGTTPPELSAAGAEAMSASDPTTAAALAAELTSAIGGGSPVSPIGNETTAASPAEAGSSGSTGTSGATAGATSPAGTASTTNSGAATGATSSPGEGSSAVSPSAGAPGGTTSALPGATRNAPEAAQAGAGETPAAAQAPGG